MSNFSATDLVTSLPEMLPYIQLLSYIFLILLFGGIAMRGLRIKTRFYIKWPIHFGVGFIGLIFSNSFASSFQFSDNLIFRIVQLDSIIAGVIGSIVLAIGLFLISKSFGLKPKLKQKKNIFRISGAVVIVAILALALVFFRGFPSIIEDISETTGISAEVFQPQKQGCVSPLVLAAEYGTKLDQLEVYNNTVLKEKIEAGERQVLQMFKVDYKGEEYVGAVAFPKDVDLEELQKTGKIDLGSAIVCSATLTDLCSCSGLPKIG